MKSLAIIFMVLLSAEQAFALVQSGSVNVPTYSPWGMATTGVLLGAAAIYTFLKKK